jgi:hypothetical protein
MIQKILASAVIFVLAFFGLSVLTKEDSECINVYIDYSILDNQTKLNKCINTSTEIVAFDVLRKANIQLEGTKKYGLAVVCRVNGLPDAKSESCETMPSEKAYWAIIIKEKQTIPFPRQEWGWGQFGIKEQYLNPGDSIGLVFADNGKVRFP